MKRVITLLALISLYNLAVSAQKKYEMVVEKTDYSETYINVEDIVPTYFRVRNDAGGSGNAVANTSCPDGNHPHYIDLGLPSCTKWACCNVGASSPEEYGNYLTFDEAQGYNPPSLDQTKELVNNTTSVWTSQNGVSGRKFTGSNGGSVFLPAAGYRRDGEFYRVGSCGYYWSSTPWAKGYGYELDFHSGNAYWCEGFREIGLSVRPVR